ncbi:MAG: 50S ribosomal protein L22 [Clostridia bacterium]
MAKYIRISSGKVGVVLDLIRGKNYKQACGILEHTPKAASSVILKCLNSAAANAEVNMGKDKERLYVAECYSMEGPTLKRVQPRAQGRAFHIMKRTSHIKVVLDEIE